MGSWRSLLQGAWGKEFGWCRSIFGVSMCINCIVGRVEYIYKRRALREVAVAWLPLFAQAGHGGITTRLLPINTGLLKRPRLPLACLAVLVGGRGGIQDTVDIVFGPLDCEVARDVVEWLEVVLTAEEAADTFLIRPDRETEQDCLVDCRELDLLRLAVR